MSNEGKSKVEVIEITDATIATLPELARDFVLGGPGPKVKLGAIERNERVNSVLHKAAESSRTLWFLRWKGTKTPHGAVLGETPILYARNGSVCSVQGDTIGIYERLVEWGGPDHDEHMMVIWAF